MYYSESVIQFYFFFVHNIAFCTIKGVRNTESILYYYIYYPNFMFGINDSSSSFKIFVTSVYDIFSFDRNLNFLKLYSNSSANYKIMNYNSSADHLLVCCSNYQRIDVFDNSLNFIKSISPIPYYPIDIDVINDLMFVSTSSNTILVYQNETYLRQITTICNSIKASIIEQTRNMATLCSIHVDIARATSPLISLSFPLFPFFVCNVFYLVQISLY